MSSVRQLNARAARIGARRRVAKNDADTGEWFGHLCWFADHHFGGDIQACACALDERIKTQAMPDEIVALLEAMRRHGDNGATPEEYIRAMAHWMRIAIAPGSLAG